MSHNIHTTFISEKVNKIRWKPDPFTDAHSFITGSWDNDVNTIKLWDFQENEEDQDIYPYMIKGVNFDGDVTELKFLNNSKFLASSSDGDVFLFNINTTETGAIEIDQQIDWRGLHRFKSGFECSCTSFAVNHMDVASVGEDGRINLFSATRKDIVQSIDNADSCCIRCVGFLKFNELLTINTRGLVKIWDLRNPQNGAETTFSLSSDNVGATTIAFHPTQKHIVVVGDEEGSLSIWDLRHTTTSNSSLHSAHSEDVTDIQFHPDRPDQMFSCSSAGELWHWSGNKPAAVSSASLLSATFNNNTSTTTTGAATHTIVGGGMEDVESSFLHTTASDKLDVYALMPKLHKSVNTLDLSRGRVLCAADNEAIYLINEVNLYK